jgi:hypothetical protein
MSNQASSVGFALYSTALKMQQTQRFLRGVAGTLARSL